MLAAGTGAGLRERMERMGHSTTRAALTYLHPSDERQRAIADALSKISADELQRLGSGRSGTWQCVARTQLRRQLEVSLVSCSTEYLPLAWTTSASTVGAWHAGAVVLIAVRLAQPAPRTKSMIGAGGDPSSGTHMRSHGSVGGWPVAAWR